MKSSLGKVPANWEIGKGRQYTFDYYFGSVHLGNFFPISALFLLHVAKNGYRVRILNSDNVIHV